jgi:hypothetical protein
MSILLGLTVTFSFFVQVGGITWSVNDKRFTTHTYYDGFPAFTQTKDGRIWFFWSKEIESKLVLYYKISSDQGKTWSQEMNLTNIIGVGENQNPSALQAKNGTIWVVWTSNRSPPSGEPPEDSDFYLNATPASLTIPQGGSDTSTINVTSINNFNDTINLYPSSVPNVTSTITPSQVYLPQNETVSTLLTVTVDATATPGIYTLDVIAIPIKHKEPRTVNIQLEITDAAAASSNAVNTESGFSPSSMVADGGIEDYDLYYKTSHDSGITWSPLIPLTSNNVDDLRPAIVQLANGTIMIVWQTYTLGSSNIVCKTTNDGISWSEPTELTTIPADDKAPAAIQAQDGKVWVVWASVRFGDYEVLYKTYNGVTWSSDQRLTYNTNSDIQPAIVQAADGDLLVFWVSGSPTSDFDVYYKSSSDDGSTWSDRTLFVATGYEDQWPAAMCTEDTKIWVAWMNNAADQPDGNWEIYWRTSLAGDVNEDHQVNVIDLTFVSLAYGSMIGDPDYNADADINKDGIIDMKDLRIVAYYLGET